MDFLQWIIYYILLVVIVSKLVYFMIKTRLWHSYFLYFIFLLSFAVLNIYGSYSFIYSIYIDTPEINFSNSFIGLLIITLSFYFILPIYQTFGRSNISIKWTDLSCDLQEKKFGVLSALLLWGICTFIILAYIILRGNLPLFQFRSTIIDLTFSQMIDIRSKAGFTKFHWYAIGFYYIPIFLTIYTYTLKRLMPSKMHSILFYITLGMGILLSVSFLFKMFVVFLFLSIGMAEIFISFKIQKRALLIGVICLIPLLCLYKIYYPVSSFVEISKLIIHRIFEVYSMATGISFSNFPNTIPFLEGVTINNPGNIFPYTHVNLSHLIFSILYGGSGGAPVPAIVEGYVNFGFSGLLVFALFIHLYIFLLHNLFYFMKKNIFNFSLYIFTAIWIIQLSMNSIFYTLLDVSVIAPFLIIMVVRYGLVPLFTQPKIKL